MGRGQHELVVCEITQRQHQYADDQKIQLAAGPRGDGLAAVYLVFAFNTFGCELKGPSEKHCKWKPDGKEQQQGMEYPGGSRDVVQNDISNLHHQPRHDDVGNAYLEDVTVFEFVE